MIEDILQLEAHKQVLKLLPPESGMCCECAIAHHRDYPHHANGKYYKYHFHLKHKRLPTWEDAIAHCSEELKELWREHLTSLGVDVYSTCTTGGIQTEEELKRRRQRGHH
jgi:hypothetical protein